MSILTVKGATVTYNRVQALSNVSFSVQDGDYFCVVGSNGSGKTSLIKGILGLVPLSGGSVEFSVTLEETAYLPQVSSITRSMPATVLEVVKTGVQKRGRRLPLYTREDTKAALDALRELGMEDMRARRVDELSGGQLQRLLLARALCRKPKLLILDEPCAGLDENVTDNLYAILHELNAERAVTILMVSHDLGQVAQYALHVAVLDHTLAFCGGKADWLMFRKEEKL